MTRAEIEEASKDEVSYRRSVVVHLDQLTWQGKQLLALYTKVASDLTWAAAKMGKK